MQTTSVGVQGQSGAQAPATSDQFSQLGTDGFLKMLVAELQNQDPMSPMDNTQILQEVSQIRQIQSNQDMVSAFDAVKLGQNMATATGLLGWNITGMNDSSQMVSGLVDRVTFENGTPRLHIGNDTIQLANVASVGSTGTSSTATQ
jgi:flagellar basal-body rod modification protein FlgD